VIDIRGVRTDDRVALSALTGEGLDELKTRILARIGVSTTPDDSAVFINLRQRRLLLEARGHIQSATRFLHQGHDTELAAIELKDALGNLQEILGWGIAPDVLDHIFEKFCIGK
jgi:tRNA modification GTPase